jgi:transposase
MNRDCFWLTEDQFARLSVLLPTDTRGKPRVDDRRVISGIVHVLKSGGRWVDAPPIYGPRKTLYNRFVRWAAKGVWVDIFQALASAGGPPAEVLIDSSAVKAHRCASGGKKGEQNQAIGRSRGGRTTKIHARWSLPPDRFPFERWPSRRLHRRGFASGADAQEPDPARRQGL